jgi:hypothetical protein
MFSIKWRCFADPILAAAAKKCSRPQMGFASLKGQVCDLGSELKGSS